MTLVLGWKCSDGIALLSDTQETVTDRAGNEYRLYVTKLIPETVGPLSYCVGGAGHAELIDEFLVGLKRKLIKPQVSTRGEFESRVERELVRFYRTEWKRCPDPAEYKHLKMLIGVSVGGQWELFTTAGSKLSPVRDFEFIGDAHALYTGFARRFFPTVNTARRAVLAGLHVLTLGEQTSNSIRGPFTVVVLNAAGAHAESPTTVEFLNRQLIGFIQDAANVLLQEQPTAAPDIALLRDLADDLVAYVADAYISVPPGTTGTFVDTTSPSKPPPLEILINPSTKTRTFVFDARQRAWIERPVRGT